MPGLDTVRLDYRRIAKVIKAQVGLYDVVEYAGDQWNVVDIEPEGMSGYVVIQSRSSGSYRTVPESDLG